MDKWIHLSSEEDTKNLAQEIANNLQGGEVIALSGELGTGKTTFTRYLVACLGGTARVMSPTFVLHRIYPVHSGSIVKVHHLDAYRLGANQDFEEGINIEELVDQKSVLVVEWADKVLAWLPQDSLIKIEFEYLEKGGRKLKIKGV